VIQSQARERFGATPGNDVFESVSALYSNLSQKNNLHFIQEKTSDKEPWVFTSVSTMKSKSPSPWKSY